MARVVAAWLLVGVAAWVVLPATLSIANSELSRATETLRLSIDEWKREEAAYRAARASARIPRLEQETYATYVAGLRLRVLEQCEVVRGLGGEEAVAPFECVRTGPQEQRTRTADVVPPSAVLTDDEKKVEMQAHLDKLESEIDESLQKRQQEIRRTASASRGSQAPGGGAAGARGGEGSRGSAGTTSTTSGTWSNPDAKPSGDDASGGDKASDRTATVGRAPPPSAAGPSEPPAAARQRPTEGGKDDDIVARQLREAAEKETDPVLKEKLWAEYRKYKEAIK
jgi:hypothetical protein